MATYRTLTNPGALSGPSEGKPKQMITELDREQIEEEVREDFEEAIQEAIKDAVEDSIDREGIREEVLNDFDEEIEQEIQERENSAREDNLPEVESEVRLEFEVEAK
jgi:hypothetical protein